MEHATITSRCCGFLGGPGIFSADALERIETKIAHLELAAAELSDVVFRQQREIQQLENNLRELQARLAATQAENLDRGADHEPPPHY